MEMKNDITVLVNSCDSYEDTWYPFFKLFHTYWENCPYRIVLNTESKCFAYDGLTIDCFRLYKNCPPAYGERMLEHLKRINTKYILVLIDDFFIQEKVDVAEIERCRGWMEENENIACFSFSPVRDEHNTPSGKYAGYEKRPTVGTYKINFQAALWRTDKFMESWKPHESPWEWEKCATFRSFFTDLEFYSRCKDAHNPINYGAKFGEAWNVVSGLWVVDSVDPVFQANDIHIDYAKRGILECAISELPRDHKRKTAKDLVNHIKSLGIKHFFDSCIYRLMRFIKKLLGLKVENDYYEYLYYKLSK